MPFYYFRKKEQAHKYEDHYIKLDTDIFLILDIL